MVAKSKVVANKAVKAKAWKGKAWAWWRADYGYGGPDWLPVLMPSKPQFSAGNWQAVRVLVTVSPVRKGR